MSIKELLATIKELKAEHKGEFNEWFIGSKVEYGYYDEVTPAICIIGGKRQ